ncbi:MAG: hypothetical protein JO227_03110 [Acetobacteraceae bacterium]|nr:hypothetical protein [Acetobacteraceae bacterium]
MRMRPWAFAIVLCAIGVPRVSNAALTQDSFVLRNAGDLVDLCSADQSDPLYTAATNFCHGFLVGVVRVLQEEESAHKARQMFCIPEPMPTRNEGIAKFVQWAKANPGQMNQQATDAVAAALAQEYPCPRSSRERNR